MANEEFLSFREALDVLRLKEEELKRLVSEGEIRAFRDGEQMKLRRTDVDHLKSELSGGEVVDLGEATEELVFEDDTEVEEAGMATEAIAEADTLVEAELDAEDAQAISRPARRAAPEAFEGLGMRAALVVTTLILVLGIPALLALSSGKSSGFAETLAGMFGGK